MEQGKLFISKKLDKKSETGIKFSQFKRERDNSWDYSDVPGSYGVYGIHPYPAMFHFLVVRRLLNELSQPSDLVLDPFMGSGVCAVECLINGRNFIGYDINPLAVLIAKVRVTPLKSKSLFQALERILEDYQKTTSKDIYFPNIDYWFDREVIDQLSKLKSSIFNLSNQKIQNFFKVVFSEVVRKVSRTDHNEFKLIRRKKENINNNVIKVFQNIALRNINLLTTFYQEFKNLKADITLKVKNIFEIPLERNYVDLIITSPPYGDSRTTVAYGQFSRLSLRWLGIEEQVDKQSLGSKRVEIYEELPSRILYQYLDEIKKRNFKRAREVYAFYFDLFRAIEILSYILKPKGKIAFVVGNRRVKGIELPTDKISADFFSYFGIKHIKTIVRAISNKRMPIENSPTNIKGKKDSTMRYEYILILRKD